MLNPLITAIFEFPVFSCLRHLCVKNSSGRMWLHSNWGELTSPLFLIRRCAANNGVLKHAKILPFCPLGIFYIKRSWSNMRSIEFNCLLIFQIAVFLFPAKGQGCKAKKSVSSWFRHWMNNDIANFKWCEVWGVTQKCIFKNFNDIYTLRHTDINFS